MQRPLKISALESTSCHSISTDLCRSLVCGNSETRENRTRHALNFNYESLTACTQNSIKLMQICTQDWPAYTLKLAIKYKDSSAGGCLRYYYSESYVINAWFKAPILQRRENVLHFVLCCNHYLHRFTTTLGSPEGISPTRSW